MCGDEGDWPPYLIMLSPLWNCAINAHFEYGTKLECKSAKNTSDHDGWEGQKPLVGIHYNQSVIYQSHNIGWKMLSWSSRNLIIISRHLWLSNSMLKQDTILIKLISSVFAANIEEKSAKYMDLWDSEKYKCGTLLSKIPAFDWLWI